MSLVNQFLAESAFAQSPAAAGLDLSAEVIVCWACDHIAEFQGTREALEAEGVIPAGTRWPDGFGDLFWGDDKFSYWLRRQRPKGVRGPRKQFIEVDWWMFRCKPAREKSWPELTLERKAKDLADEIYRQSAEGQAQWDAHWKAYFAAEKDKAFQAFKSLIPGVNRPKRGRRLASPGAGL
jgi:hypothetical protein